MSRGQSLSGVKQFFPSQKTPLSSRVQGSCDLVGKYLNILSMEGDETVTLLPHPMYIARVPRL